VAPALTTRRLQRNAQIRTYETGNSSLARETAFSACDPSFKRAAGEIPRSLPSNFFHDLFEKRAQVLADSDLHCADLIVQGYGGETLTPVRPRIRRCLFNFLDLSSAELNRPLCS